MEEIRDYNLRDNNTFGVEAHCDRFIAYGNVEEAQLAAAEIRHASDFLILGGGSNLLLTKDFKGLVVTPECRFEVEQVGEDATGFFLKCWAGTLFDEVIEYAIAHQMYGAENLSLIPGEVGASAVQNIGAYGAEVKELVSEIEAVEIATEKVVFLQKEDCEYSYRQSKFKNVWKNKYLITAVTYKFRKTFEVKLDYGNIRAELAKEQIEKPNAKQLREAIIRIRQAKLPDPKVLGNAGSFFMNPIVETPVFIALQKQYPQMPHYTIDTTHEKIPAGWLIDQCGWKGKTIGRVGVHDKQALVLVNRGNATGAEILALCRQVQQDVFERFGINIHPEVNIV